MPSASRSAGRLAASRRSTCAGARGGGRGKLAGLGTRRADSEWHCDDVSSLIERVSSFFLARVATRQAVLLVAIGRRIFFGFFSNIFGFSVRFSAWLSVLNHRNLLLSLCFQVVASGCCEKKFDVSQALIIGSNARGTTST